MYCRYEVEQLNEVHWIPEKRNVVHLLLKRKVDRSEKMNQIFIDGIRCIDRSQLCGLNVDS